MSFLLLVGVLIVSALQAEQSCSEFEFETHDPNNITVKENSTLQLNFLIGGQTLQTPYLKVSIERQVSEQQSSAERPVTGRHSPRICQLALGNQSCSVGKGADCNCAVPTPGVYQLLVFVNRRNDGVWSWFTDSPAVKNSSIRVEATYPPQIHSVTFHHEGTTQNTVVPHTTVEIVCVYDPGYPESPFSPSLTREDGTWLAPDNGSEPHRLVHTIHSVTCRDAWNVTCHAYGQAKSAQLIVDCSQESATPVISTTNPQSPSDQQEESSSDAMTNFGFLLLGAIAIVCVIVVITVVVVGAYVKRRGSAATPSSVQPENGEEAETLNIDLRPLPAVPTAPAPCLMPPPSGHSQGTEPHYVEIPDHNSDGDNQPPAQSPSPPSTRSSDVSHLLSPANVSQSSSPPSTAAPSDVSSLHPSSTSQSSSHTDDYLDCSQRSERSDSSEDDQESNLPEGYLHPIASDAEKSG